MGLWPDESPLVSGDFGPYRQSDRLHIYTEYVEQMVDSGHAYKCFCTEKRLDLLRREAARSRQPNRYDGRCCGLSKDEVREKIEAGLPYTVRFKLTPFPEPFNDLVYGPVSHDVSQFEGDFVILKSDGFPTYHLANVVDDHLMEITDVLRGVEWQVSTPKHILMYRALGWTPPNFAHLPLIMNSDGTKLSKRQGDLHVDSLKNEGFFPEAVLNFITLFGGAFSEKEYSLETVYSLESLCEKFSIDKVHTASCKIEMEWLANLNRVALKERLKCSDQKSELIREAKAAILEATKESGQSKELINDERIEKYLLWGQDRIHKVSDLAKDDFMFLWSDPDSVEFEGPLSLLKSVKSVLLDIKDDELQVKELVKKLKKIGKDHSVKYPEMMKMLRQVISGQLEGPPVADVIKILGIETVVHRLDKILSKSASCD